MANYERMWNSLKQELKRLEEHYSNMRLNYAQKGQPTLAAQFKERGEDLMVFAVLLPAQETPPLAWGRPKRQYRPA